MKLSLVWKFIRFNFTCRILIKVLLDSQYLMELLIKEFLSTPWNLMDLPRGLEYTLMTEFFKLIIRGNFYGLKNLIFKKLFRCNDMQSQAVLTLIGKCGNRLRLHLSRNPAASSHPRLASPNWPQIVFIQGHSKIERQIIPNFIFQALVWILCIFETFISYILIPLFFYYLK